MSNTIKTAVAFQSAFKAVEAEPCGQHFGEEFVIHHTPNHRGWSFTHIRTGLAILSKIPAKSKVIETAREHIERNGVDKFKAALSKYPSAPAVDTLQPHVEKPKAVAKPAANIDNIVRAIALDANLNEQEAAAVRSALSTRSGILKAKAPSDDWGKAAWNGLQPNAWKIQFSACFLRGGPGELLSKLSKINWPVALDKDLSTLRSLGVA